MKTYAPARLRLSAVIAENLSLYVVLIAVFILMFALNGEKFIRTQNLISMAYQLPIVGLLAIGMMISMLSGGINLSIISTANLNGIIIALVLQALSSQGMKLAGVELVLLAVLLGFVACLLVGVINGLLISILKIPDILVTLGTMTLIAGLNVVLTRGYTLSGFPDSLLNIGNGTSFGIPNALILFVVAAIVASIILNKTRFGFSLYMMGSNATAAQYANVNLVKITVMQYVFSSTFAALTSLVMMGQLNSVKASYADSYLLVAVLAAFLGKVSPFGGFGRVSGVVLAVIILQMISSGLNLLRLDPFMITATWGAIIIAIVVFRGLFSQIKLRMAK
ncbi:MULTISPECIES: ABC transporter permease [unclassified Pantoea]|uniref:ABC transporter permease n=1 Tax=unclassified Pantoea TaxID=2630326 RepID=UPI001CD289AA|nr:MULTISPECIES: ABC transporter permease [unclassified Pantoea]MCA1174930.1 ABC transporter permease [Pantoea sp. alder69]MCA1249892.1 ABC transporter permease [Pantoea sp. alder70]MCA1264153.1 ABC transporter permease [Pantoea sp. alder81]